MRIHFFKKVDPQIWEKWILAFPIFDFFIAGNPPIEIQKTRFSGSTFPKIRMQEIPKSGFPVFMGWVAGHVFGQSAAMGQDTHNAAERQSGSQQPHYRRTTADQRRCPGGLAAVLEPRQHEGSRPVPLRSAPHGWHISGTQPHFLASKGAHPAGARSQGRALRARSYIDVQHEMFKNL